MLGKYPIFKTRMSWYCVHFSGSVWRSSRGESFKCIFGKLDYGISPDRIEACHRVSRTNDTVIVKFSWQKDSQHVWSVKKDLKKLTTEELELPGNSKLFINRSLCPYDKMLWSKNKKLHSLSKIQIFFISGDTIKIRVNENSSLLSITHVDNFGKHFPDVYLSAPSRKSWITKYVFVVLWIISDIVELYWFLCSLI